MRKRIGTDMDGWLYNTVGFGPFLNSYLSQFLSPFLFHQEFYRHVCLVLSLMVLHAPTRRSPDLDELTEYGGSDCHATFRILEHPISILTSS